MRHDRRPHREAPAARFEPAHHAPDRLAAEATAAAEHDAVHGRHEVAGVEIIESDDVVRAAAQLDAADRGTVTQHHRDAGEAREIGRVADANARDVGDHAAGRLAAHVGSPEPPGGDLSGQLERALRHRPGERMTKR